MIPETVMASGSSNISGLNSENVGSNPETDCDNLKSFDEEEDDEVNQDNFSDHSMASETSQERRTLRPIAKKNYTERLNKKSKPVIPAPAVVAPMISEDVLEDSDAENELVIDCDIPNEENNSTKTKSSETILTINQDDSCSRSKDKDNNDHSDVIENGIPDEDSVTHNSELDENDEEAVASKKPKLAHVRVNGLKVSKLKKLHRSAHHRLLSAAKSIKKSNSLKNQSTQNEENEEEAMEELQTEGSRCPICEEEFNDSHSFTVHIRDHNSKNYTHTCKICSKRLSSASSLDRHMYVHSGERPFQCSICSLKFTTNGNMHRHMKIHESNSAEVIKTARSDKKSPVKRQSNGKKSSGPATPTKGEQAPKTNSFKEADKDSELENSSEPKETKDKSFSCMVCGKYFLTPGTLKSHMFVHSNDPIKCSICNVTSKNYTSYLEHSCSSDSNKNSNKRLSKVGFHDLSFVEFSTSKFALIAKQMCEEQSRDPSSAFFSWECAKCAKAFPSDKTLMQHEDSHETGTAKTCHTCKCDFPSRKCFQDHQLRHRTTETAMLESSKKEEKSDKEDFLALLELCDKRRVSPVKQSTNKQKPKKLDGFGYFSQEITPQGDDSQDTMDSSRDFADINSIISLTSRTPLVPDMRTSPVTASPASPPRATVALSVPVSPIIEGSANPIFETPVPNGNCSDSYSAKEDEEMSVTDPDAREVENENQLFCKKCSKSFVHPNDLKQHMLIHTKGGSLHQCSFCPYQSVDKSTLKRHLRKHNGEHPFKCSICDYVFTTKANGHRHVRNKHKLSDIEAADAVVYNPNMLESKDTDSLSGEANTTETVCKYCKIDFKYNRVLRHHLRSLNNSCSRKPYSCSLCKQGFSTKNNCIRHVTNHHPECRDIAKELVIANETSQSSSPSETPTATYEPLNLSGVTDSRDHSQNADSSGEEFPGSDAEIVSVAESLVSLSELMPPQDQPLDLTICALNLSLKESEMAPDLSSKSVVPTHAEMDCSEASNMSSTSEETQNPKEPKNLDPPVTHQTSPVNLTNVPKPLNLVKNSMAPVCLVADISSREDSNSGMTAVAAPSPAPVIQLQKSVSEINRVITNKSAIPVVIVPPIVAPLLPSTVVESAASAESLKSAAAGQKVKKFSCWICMKGFTLKSNRERHVKNHHPEHARPPRSRNYIPTLTSATTTTVQKPTTSALSEKTRDALRFTLISKNNGNCAANKSPSKSTFVTQPTQTLSPVRLLIPSEKKDSSIELHNKSKNNDVTDLASVSSVIDTVNCQTFKQYLIEAKDLPSNDHLSNCNTSTDNVSLLSASTKANNESLKNSSGDVLPLTESKRSSYAKCVKSIHCSYCKRKFPWKSSLSRHLLTHTGLKPHKCPKCPLSFTTKSNRDRHLYRQHGNMIGEVSPLNEKPFKCNLCTTSCYFATRAKLKKHYFVKHSSILPDTEGTALYLDMIAGQGDGKESLLEKEESYLNNISKGQQKLSVSDEDEEEEMGSDDASDSLECHVCGRAFMSQATLLSHLKVCHPLMMGGDSTESSPEKSDHLAVVVPTIKVEPDDTTNNNESISGPSDKNEYSCHQCTLTFHTAHELQLHTKTHQKQGSKNITQNNCQSSSSSAVANGFSLPKLSAGLPKKTPNSLLYLFAAAQHARSVDSAMESAQTPTDGANTNNSSGSKSRASAASSSSSQRVNPSLNRPQAASAASAESTDGDENALILNLLGLKDPEFLDEMLDSAVRSRVKKEPVEV